MYNVFHYAKKAYDLGCCISACKIGMGFWNEYN